MVTSNRGRNQPCLRVLVTRVAKCFRNTLIKSLLQTDMLFQKIWAVTFIVILSTTTPRAFGSVQRSTRVENNPSQYVNTFIGTANSPLPDYLGGNSSGNTFP